MTDLVDRTLALDDRRSTGDASQGSSRPPVGGRLVAVLVVLVGLALLAGAATLLLGLGRRLGGGAVATVLVADGMEVAAETGWTPLRPGSELREGARVRTGPSEGRLRFGDGEVWLGPGAAAAVHSRHVDLIRGETVVRSGGLLAARWADVEVIGSGTFRVTPGTNPRVAVYAGSVEVRRPAESRAVGALQQLGLAARRLPADTDPLEYRADDPWDREQLGQAIAFDDEVDRIARGIDLRYTRAPRPVDFYRAFSAVDESTIPILQAAARESLGDGQFGPPSDVLVTLFVADAAARAEALPLADTAAQIARRRAAGARWGLVALERRLTAQQFAQAVDLSQIEQVAGAAFGVSAPAFPPPPPDQQVRDLVPRLSPPVAPRALSSPDPRGSRKVTQVAGERLGSSSDPPPRSSWPRSDAPPPRSDGQPLREVPSTPSVPPPGVPAPPPAAPAPPLPEDGGRGRELVEGTVDALLEPRAGLLEGAGS